MGGSQSREGLELSDESDYSDDEEEENEEQDLGKYADAEDSTPKVSAKAPEEVYSRQLALKLKYLKDPSPSPQKANIDPRNAVKLYLHIDSNTPKVKWIVSEKLSYYKFVKKLRIDDGDDDEHELGRGEGFWVFKLGKKINAKVSTYMQMKFFGDQMRVDFVDGGAVLGL